MNNISAAKSRHDSTERAVGGGLVECADSARRRWTRFWESKRDAAKRRDGSSRGPATQAASRSCAYFSFAPFPSRYANTVQVLEMCGALDRYGLETTLFARPSAEGAHDWPRVLSDYGMTERILVCWVPTSPSKWRSRWRVFATAFLTSSHFDLCYTRSPIAAAGCVLRRRQCVYEMHSPHLPRLEAALVRVIKRCDSLRIVAISGVLAELVSLRFHMPRSAIIVEHDACRLPDDQSAAQKSNQRLRVVYVGSFYPGRGVELIVRLAQTHGDVDFVAAGGNQGDLTVPIPANLQLPGRIPHAEVAQLLSTADVLVMPYGRRVTVDGMGDSSQFCSPLKLFEYLAAGRAIVATRTPSISEILTYGENALLAEPDDFSDWSRALDTVKHSLELRERLSQGALRTASDHTWDGRVRRILGPVA